MSSAFIALGLGTVLAVGALAFVLYPLFFELPGRRTAPAPTGQSGLSDDLAVAALREIEFDRATGKLSDADYVQLKERYTREALQHMRREAPLGGVAAAGTDDRVEAAIRAYRAQQPTCAVCGPRPESDAAFCSECGRYLRGSCEQCGRQVQETGARFCAACGHRLAA
jgi:hypothetical protein